MKFSYSLLKKIYPKIPPIAKVAGLLPLHVFEVESVEGDVFDVKILPNRYSDAASHVGLAREIAAIVGAQFSFDLRTIKNKPVKKGKVLVSIQDKAFCTRYSARYFETSKSIPSSPLWMQKILSSCGIQSINALVDVTNYTMLVTGQPLHVFDFDRMAKNKKGACEIIARNGVGGEVMLTLDGREVAVSGIPVIADGVQPLALAGIKGGAHAGVTTDTRRFILEAATFNGPSIFRASRALGITTDASVRFSHDISSSLVEMASDFATNLYTELGAVFLDSVDSDYSKESPRTIAFDPSAYQKLIGTSVSASDASSIFKRLGFGVSPLPASVIKKFSPKSFLVMVPVWRRDISTLPDLCEELVRIIGVASVPAIPPVVSLAHPVTDDVVVAQGQVRTILGRLGFDQVYTTSFVSRVQTEFSFSSTIFGDSQKPVEVANPISSEKNFLRTSLLPGLLVASASNVRFYESASCFEIGHVCASVAGRIDEAVSVAFVSYHKKTPVLIREIKGALEELFSSFGITDYSISSDGSIAVGGDRVGALVHTSLEDDVWMSGCEINLSVLVESVSSTRAFTPFAKFPSIVRDISFLVSRDHGIGEIADALYQAGQDRFLSDVDLIDEYVDEVRFSGSVSLTFRLVFSSEERSLTDEEVNVACEYIQKTVAGLFSAQIR